MKTLNSNLAPEAIGPYSQATVHGDFIFVSGQLPISNGVLQTEISQATKACLENIKAILNEAKLNLSDVVKTTVYLSDMENFTAMNEVYAQYFSAPYPARACIEVSKLPKNAIVEIECIAKNDLKSLTFVF